MIVITSPVTVTRAHMPNAGMSLASDSHCHHRRTHAGTATASAPRASIPASCVPQAVTWAWHAQRVVCRRRPTTATRAATRACLETAATAQAERHMHGRGEPGGGGGGHLYATASVHPGDGPSFRGCQRPRAHGRPVVWHGFSRSNRSIRLCRRGGHEATCSSTSRPVPPPHTHTPFPPAAP